MALNEHKPELQNVCVLTRIDPVAHSKLTKLMLNIFDYACAHH